MRNVNETGITDEVVRSYDSASDPRLHAVMVSLIRHLHGFVAEVRPSEAEWFAAIDFLTRTGQISDDARKEFVLLSDTLGVSMLVDQINHAAHDGATESTVLGPFYVANAPEFALGASIARPEDGDPALVSGRVLNVDGQPLGDALLDVWQASANGLYDIQDPSQPQPNLRGRFRADDDGRFRFRTIRPVPYPVPDDGPVGKLLRLTGRHPWRAAHIHFIVSADGHNPVTTHVFDAASAYLDSDTVFGVKESLVRPFVRHAPPAPNAGVSGPVYTVEYDFVLTRTPA